MANHKSALKRAKQSVKRNQRNRGLMSGYRTEIKRFSKFVNDKNLSEARKLLPAIYKMIDKTCSKGCVKKNTASRKKSRMALMLNKANSAEAK